ncbi:MAG: VanZ family protein [Gemmataceae bacterium]|nr:VanZ family protein [Gemmataceae bacterium]
MKRRWLAFALFSAVWTALLVMPGTVHDEIPLGEFLRSRRVVLAKCVHVGCYAVFAVLAGRLPLALAGRLMVLYGLMLHAAATEFIQLYVVQRSGSLSDVLFDDLGILIGLAASWKSWTREEPN